MGKFEDKRWCVSRYTASSQSAAEVFFTHRGYYAGDARGKFISRSATDIYDRASDGPRVFTAVLVRPFATAAFTHPLD